MERRKFIGRAALAFMAGLVLPIDVWAQKMRAGTYRSFDLPAPLVHVRHGLLELKKQEVFDLPFGVRDFRSDVFFANGATAGGQDWHSIQMKADGHSVQLHLVEDKAWICTDQGSPTHISRQVRKGELFESFSNAEGVFITPETNFHFHARKGQRFCILSAKNVQIDHQGFSAHALFEVNEPRSFSVKNGVQSSILYVF